MVTVRWYLRYGLSYRDVEELRAGRGIEVDQIARSSTVMVQGGVEDDRVGQQGENLTIFSLLLGSLSAIIRHRRSCSLQLWY
jgi:hypothetical protein